jgi:hypothetical protein
MEMKSGKSIIQAMKDKDSGIQRGAARALGRI